MAVVGDTHSATPRFWWRLQRIVGQHIEVALAAFPADTRPAGRRRGDDTRFGGATRRVDPDHNPVGVADIIHPVAVDHVGGPQGAFDFGDHFTAQLLAAQHGPPIAVL